MTAPAASKEPGRRFFERRDVVLYLCCFAAILYTGWASHHQDVALEKEANERRNETCLSFEYLYVNEVDALADAYDVLSGLTGAELHLPFTQLLIVRLPGLQQVAKSPNDTQGIRVPDYCDDPGVGLDTLPEPPPRPPDLPKAAG